MHALTFVSGNRLEEVERNVGTPADHCLELEAGEEGEEGHGHDPGHALSDGRGHGVELVQAEVEREADILGPVLRGHA